MKNRWEPLTVAGGRAAYAATAPDIEQITVAAIDESIGDNNWPFRTLHMAIVCSPPGTPSRENTPTSEQAKQALKTLEGYGLLIRHNTSYPSTYPSLHKELATNWIRGLTNLVQQAQEELMTANYPPIGLLYVDGSIRRELYPLIRGETFNGDGKLVKGELEGITFVPAIKNRNHNYSEDLNPLGRRLLNLADYVAGFLREIDFRQA